MSTESSHLGSDPGSTTADADVANGEPGADRPLDEPTGASGRGAGDHALIGGTDTPTGTDPTAKFTESGYQDVSLGQAVDRDARLVEDLLEETGGDVGEAERRFDEEATGAPTLRRQRGGRDHAAHDADGPDSGGPDPGGTSGETSDGA